MFMLLSISKTSIFDTFLTFATCFFLYQKKTNMASEGGSTLSSWLVNLLYTGGAVFAGGLLLLYVYQEKLLYFPTIPGAAKFTHENPPGNK
jgi:hypothetical protein